MRLAWERRIMGVLLAALPVALYGLVIRPYSLRAAELRHRIRAAHEESPEVRSFIPVGTEERAFLEAPGAPWRTRIPLLADEGERLAQVDHVVGAVTAALKAKGVKVTGMRADWNPVTARFTIPAGMEGGGGRRSRGSGGPDHKLAAWVLEVEIGGGTEDLFKALSVLPAINPLLEPVGLRWEAAGEGPEARRRQVLLLRNLYLEP